MREPGSLIGDAGDLYRERKRAIAIARVHVVTSLQEARQAEERGELYAARVAARNAHMFTEDVLALYEAWLEDVPQDETPAV